jgi:DNA polymerase-3 subunit alpha
MEFTHLHVHSQFSILDGAASVEAIVDQAKELNQKAIAITDHGNMFAAKKFYDVATKNGIKPIIGIEAYVARRTRHDKTKQHDSGSFHLVLLAKNQIGYKNLIKMASIAYSEGFYHRPRIDRELLEKHSEGIIVSSACLGGEIPQSILKGTEEDQDEAINWYKNIFGDDYYLEVMLHKDVNSSATSELLDLQEKVNHRVFELAAKHNVKVIATNDTHFVKKNNAEAHDRLICINTGANVYDENRMKYSGQEYIKSVDEMIQLFPDHTEAIQNTQEIVNKIEDFDLNSKPIMPDFPLPEGFDDEDDYLKFLAYEGAVKRYAKEECKQQLPETDREIDKKDKVYELYATLTSEEIERIDFELETVKKMGFPGYFLIVWDFINAAKTQLGVWVGPGRGSAAGSAVAYSLGITDIDPIKYDLLFERFLNPDRISMPDVDIDFDEDGRERVMEYVVQKYGYEKVAHIITFGTIAAKSAIRDVARVQQMPLNQSDQLAKLVPDGISKLKKAFNESPELVEQRDHGEPEVRDVLNYASQIEGSVRQVGVHACGIIIGKDDLSEFLPMCVNKDAKLQVTQFDGRLVESVGMLKMDFLGLRTLSIMKDAVDNIRLSTGIEIDVDKIPLDDPKTMELYSRGDTTAIFQFESEGMKNHLRSLKPSKFMDLVAMNALYRPGPMAYIPSFINRKHGTEQIEYDHPLMEKYLKDTYGITVFQEQVMLLSRLLAGFTRGDSDTLRKAMGKKLIAVMDKLKLKFIDGCKANPEFMKGCDEYKKDADQVIEKIWKDWEKFAEYAFNKSHSVCYAFVSYKTAYLKAHYPAEFLASVLSRSPLDKLPFMLSECNNMKIDVLGPDVNESRSQFVVNSEGKIRYGFDGLKGLGEKATETIIDERESNGHYSDIYDFVERINNQSVNKGCMEALALSGSFDDFNIQREIFVEPNENGDTFTEIMIKYAQLFKNDKMKTMNSLFADEMASAIKKPDIFKVETWPNIERLNREKDVIGIYISAHPLDDYKIEIESFANSQLNDIFGGDLKNAKNKINIKLAGIIKSCREGMTKNGKPFGVMTLSDYSGDQEFAMFGKDYIDFKSKIQANYAVLVTGDIKPKFYDENQFEFKIKAIELLSFLHDRITSLNIEMPINSINKESVSQLKNCIESSTGKMQINIKVVDKSNEDRIIDLDMFSRSVKVDVNSDFIENLNKIPEIKYTYTTI